MSNAQVIEIGEGALLEGDLLVDNVNVLRILGDFRGNIAGNFQTLEWPRRDAESESEAE